MRVASAGLSAASWSFQSLRIQATRANLLKDLGFRSYGSGVSWALSRTYTGSRKPGTNLNLQSTVLPGYIVYWVVLRFLHLPSSTIGQHRKISHVF